MIPSLCLKVTVTTRYQNISCNLKDVQDLSLLSSVFDAEAQIRGARQETQMRALRLLLREQEGARSAHDQA